MHLPSVANWLGCAKCNLKATPRVRRERGELQVHLAKLRKAGRLNSLHFQIVDSLIVCLNAEQRHWGPLWKFVAAINIESSSAASDAPAKTQSTATVKMDASSIYCGEVILE